MVNQKRIIPCGSSGSSGSSGVGLAFSISVGTNHKINENNISTANSPIMLCYLSAENKKKMNKFLIWVLMNPIWIIS